MIGRRVVLLLILGGCCASPRLSSAQGRAVVAASDLVYGDIDRLSELGILNTAIIGQRPYSRREIDRIIRVARERMRGGSHRVTQRLSEETLAYAEAILRRMEQRYGVDSLALDPVVSMLDGASLTYTSTDADRRGFPAPITSPIEATIDPLAERRLGNPAVRGQFGVLEFSHRAEPVPWLAVQLRERVSRGTPHDTTQSAQSAELLLASTRGVFHNVALTLGRQQITWAQTAGDGLFLASDAPTLDALSLTGDAPFRLPGFLSALGPAQATLLLADLGATRVRSHSRLLAYKVSVEPASAVELGGTFTNHFGGAGARTSSLKDRIVDFLPFIDVLQTHNYADSSRTLDVESDKALGVDGRLRIDQLAGVLVTGELLIDDFDIHRLPKLLTGYGSQTLSITFPQLGSPAFSARLNAIHMGTITYSHSQLINGMSTRGRLLGNELGPDAKSYSAQLRVHPSSSTRLELEARSAIYSNATYETYYSDAAQTRYHVRKLSRTADELREIALGTLVIQSDDGIALTFRGGVQRVRGAFSGPQRRVDYVADMSLRIGH
ncbi:MAG: capsule assembly Wzi family protein [Gemmatimonadota bacterium]